MSANYTSNPSLLKTMKIKKILLIHLIFVFSLLSACTQDKGETSSNAIEYSWKGIRGDTITLSDYRGQWLVLNYWATWCPPCREEMPELDAFHQHHSAKGVASVIGVNYEEVDSETLNTFLEEYFITFPIVKMENLSGVTPFGNIVGLPTTFVLNPQGELVFGRAGVISESELNEIISKK